MDDRQVFEESMTLFLAGHETTANATSGVWYALSQNPAPQAKLQQAHEASELPEAPRGSAALHDLLVRLRLRGP